MYFWLDVWMLDVSIFVILKCVPWGKKTLTSSCMLVFSIPRWDQGRAGTGKHPRGSQGQAYRLPHSHKSESSSGGEPVSHCFFPCLPSKASCWCDVTCMQGLVSSLMEQSPEEIGDLYLDVGEANLDQGEYWAALPLLSALVASEKYNLAVVWLRHAGRRHLRLKTTWSVWTPIEESLVCYVQFF